MDCESARHIWIWNHSGYAVSFLDNLGTLGIDLGLAETLEVVALKRSGQRLSFQLNLVLEEIFLSL